MALALKVPGTCSLLMNCKHFNSKLYSKSDLYANIVDAQRP